MRTALDRPFSRRNREHEPRVRDDFPETARTALLYLLVRLNDERYLKGGMPAAMKEVSRLARIRLSHALVLGAGDDTQPAEVLFHELPWQRVFDFCERLYSTLATSTTVLNIDMETMVEDKSVQEVRLEIEREIQNLFDEENLDYEFVEGKVVRATTSHTTNILAKADVALASPDLSEARVHFRKAQNFFKDKENPDYRNAAKEAVCAVEAAAKRLFPGDGNTLDEVIKRLQKDKILDATIAKSFTGIYAFRNSGKGVAHGEGTGAEATRPIAEFVLDSAASQILLLAALHAEQDTSVPF